MWVFTPYGFFSAVAYREHAKGPIDPHKVLVRARVEKHLRNLLEKFGLKDVEIAESRSTDYRYRIVLHKLVWAAIMEALATEINYPNFKGECQQRENQKQLDGFYVDTLHDVWGATHELQERTRKKVVRKP